MKRHIPNVLTFSRIPLGLLIAYCFNVDSLLWGIAGMFLFVCAAVTDYYDGKLARAWGCSGKFGAFLDPAADKFFCWSLIVGVILPHREIWTWWQSADSFAYYFADFGAGPLFYDWRLLLFGVLIFALYDIGTILMRIWHLFQGTEMTTSSAAKRKTAVLSVAFGLMLPLFSWGQGTGVEWLGFALFYIVALETLHSAGKYLRLKRNFPSLFDFVPKNFEFSVVRALSL